MKYLTTSLTILILCSYVSPVPAVIIYECVDDGGNLTYRDRCPPGTTSSNEMKIYIGAKKTVDAPDVAIAFYTTPTCDACDVIRTVLEKYGASYTEKNVEKDIALQTELQQKSGGSNTLSVPTVIVGEKVIVGYNKQALISSLEEVGFKNPDVAQPASGPEAETAEPEAVPETQPETGEQTTETATE